MRHVVSIAIESLLILLTLNLSLLNASAILEVSASAGHVLVWSANFETGDNSQFNGDLESTCANGVVGVSSTIVHSGRYAGYYYGQGNSSSASCREFKNLNLYVPPYSNYQPLNDFYFEMWVYVIPNPDGKLAGWISFATFDTPHIGFPFTIDGETNNQICLYVSLEGGKLTCQNLNTQTLIQFPFHQWFNVAVLANIIPNTTTSNVTVYYDGLAIIQNEGNLLNGPFAYGHFGLYMSTLNPSVTILNDDMELWKISS